jgi:hypothetical protein
MLFAFAVRAFERYLIDLAPNFIYRPFYEDRDYSIYVEGSDKYQNYYIWNAIWLVVVTMTTGNNNYAS